MGDGYLCVERGRRERGRIIPSALVESGCRIGEGARIGGRVVLERGVTVGDNTTIERAVVMQGRRDRQPLHAARLHRRRGVRIGDRCTSRAWACSARASTLGAGNVVSNGARLFPGVTLPDGALAF